MKHSPLSGIRAGFALPTVLIASVVLLTILVISVTATTSVRTTLMNQHYTQLAKVAGEAGVEFAKACLQASGNVPTWTNDRPLTPATDCNGNLAIGPAVSVLVVGGGGGGGEGGGGAGGVVEQMAALTTAPINYSIVVGGGGSASSNGSTGGANGGASSALGLTAAGGGRGGTSGSSTTSNGGSGGGGRRDGGTVGGSPTDVTKGNPGGTSLTGLTFVGGAGGGGAGSSGQAGTGTGVAAAEAGGNGGFGISSSITGEFLFYAGGGGGGTEGSGGVSSQRGMGGTGGGGNGFTRQGGVATATAGAANTGSGGGGRPTTNGSGAAGAGGSGVVVIAYPVNSGIQATGGTRTIVGSNVVHRFTGSTTFAVQSVGSASCPTDPRCSVLVEEDLRTSFRVGAPQVDASGKALTIPQTGYTEVLRKSTGAVWRKFEQPAIQSAAVPDLCFGAASSARGWANATIASTQTALAGAPSAQSLTLANGNLSAGKIYLRKDFTITTSGAYNIRLATPTSGENANLWLRNHTDTSVMNAPTLSSYGQTAVSAAPMNLAPGCYSLAIELSNTSWDSRPLTVAAAVIPEGNDEPVVVTDGSWRVAAGSSVHYSDSHYNDDYGWVYAEDFGATQHLLNNSWEGRSRDRFTHAITSTHSATGADRPANATTYFRDSKDIELGATTDVQFTAMCDDSCSIYMDGEKIADSTGSNSIFIFNRSLSAGSHRIGVRLTNGSGPSRLSLAAVRASDGAILTRTDRTWKNITSWEASSTELYAYDNSFTPSPSFTQNPGTYEVTVVGGGGGSGRNAAGGGGGGGVRVMNIEATVGASRTVTIGAGAAAGVGSAVGSTGGTSSLWIASATGGGGGPSRDSTAMPTTGASGGGGAGAFQSTTNHIGAAATPGLGFGNRGGNGTPRDQSCNATGGGGGGAGGIGVDGTGTGNPVVNGISGDGGPGYISYYTGSPVVLGAGGAGSITCNGTPGLADANAGNGGTNSTGNNGTANTGGGGGASGGNGGSGVVLVRFPTGLYTAATTGTVTSGTFNGYTWYRFTGNGTFRITAINN